MNPLITGYCSALHTGVGFGQTPVRPGLIVEEDRSRQEQKNTGVEKSEFNSVVGAPLPD